MSKVRQVYGNRLELAIPLQQVVATSIDGVVTTTTEDFIPSGSVYVRLWKCPKNPNPDYSFKATMSGNVATIIDEGNILVGQYDVEVLAADSQQNPYRFYQRDALDVVAATADAGIAAGIEFDVETQTLAGMVVLVIHDGEGGSVSWDDIADKPTFATVATSGAYSDLSGKPDLSGYITKDVSNLTNYYTKTENDSTDEKKSNKVTSISSESTDTQYPSAKLLYDQLALKQGTLTFDDVPTTDSANPVKSGGVKTAVDACEEKTNKVTSISSASTDTQYPSAKCVYDAIQQGGGGGGDESTANKKDTIVGNESSTTYYPSTKAVADYVPTIELETLIYLAEGADIRDPNDAMEAPYMCKYNRETGYFEMNGLTDITVDEMKKIYAHMDALAYYEKGDSQFVALRTYYPSRNIYTIQNNSFVWGQSTTESLCLGKFVNLANQAKTTCFHSFPNLRHILPKISAWGDSTGWSGDNCLNLPNLETMYIHMINANITFAKCPKINYASLRYLVNYKSNSTTAITVTVHATTYGYLDGSITPTEQVGGTTAEWQQLKSDGEAKAITWATPT